MIGTELLIGLPAAVIAVAVGAALLVTRARIAARLGGRPDATTGDGGLATAVVFLVGFSLVFMGTGIALFLVTRALTGIAPEA
jgi:hypothetical protein